MPPQSARDVLDTLIMVDTLEYLRKGGRIGGAQAWIGGALKIKPLITLEETVAPVDKVRDENGTRLMNARMKLLLVMN